MHQPPGARVTLGVQRTAIFRVVMLLKAGRKIAGLSDVNFPLGVQKDINKTDGWSIRGFGSSARTRTWNPSVNSRMLYH